MQTVKRFFITSEKSKTFEGHTYILIAVEGVSALAVKGVIGNWFNHHTYTHEEHRVRDRLVDLLCSGTINTTTGEIEYDEVPRVINQ